MHLLHTDKDGRAHGLVYATLGGPAVGPGLLLVDRDQPWKLLEITYELDGKPGLILGSGWQPDDLKAIVIKTLKTVLTCAILCVHLLGVYCCSTYVLLWGAST